MWTLAEKREQVSARRALPSSFPLTHNKIVTTRKTPARIKNNPWTRGLQGPLMILGGRCFCIINTGGWGRGPARSKKNCLYNPFSEKQTFSKSSKWICLIFCMRPRIAQGMKSPLVKFSIENLLHGFLGKFWVKFCPNFGVFCSSFFCVNFYAFFHKGKVWSILVAVSYK